MAGYSSNASGNQDMTVWRFHDDGTPDAGFNGTGRMTHDNPAAGGNATTRADGDPSTAAPSWSPAGARAPPAATTRRCGGSPAPAPST
ncbi:MAG: hypothetical protein IPG75_15115 [Gemmatimonadetes bacterium]|nr:hypothetical protein [Gemmatimonadota bacterium]